MQGQSDEDWGRVPGAVPPIPSWLPPLFWLATSAALAAVVLAVVPRPGPLDDPDPAQQRPGFLTAAVDARSVEGLRLPGDPIGRRPVLIVFDRKLPDAAALATLERRLPKSLATVVVVAGGVGPARFPVPVVIDRQARIAQRVSMRTPKDDGAPIGYALVDRQARLRYATLDPGYLEHRGEDATLARAVS